MLAYFVVFIVHRTVMDYRIFNVPYICDLFACVYTRGSEVNTVNCVLMIHKAQSLACPRKKSVYHRRRIYQLNLNRTDNTERG